MVISPLGRKTDTRYTFVNACFLLLTPTNATSVPPRARSQAFSSLKSWETRDGLRSNRGYPRNLEKDGVGSVAKVAQEAV